MVHRKILGKVNDLLENRPLWSVIIPTYNCAHYAREAIQSILIQDPGADKMEIIVVDDASNDDIEDVVISLGQGRVLFFKQPTNVGHINNFYKGLELSTGEFIHILHGDDAVLWGYYNEMESLFTSFPEVGAAYCRYHFIDSNSNIFYTGPLELASAGIFNNFLTKISSSSILQTPCISVKRSVYETIGMFDNRLKFTEDWEMWQRIGVNFSVAYSPKVLALYRNNHGSNHTNFVTTGGELINDLNLLYSVLKFNLKESIPDIDLLHQKNLIFILLHALPDLYSKGYRKVALSYYIQSFSLKLKPSNHILLIKLVFKLELKRIFNRIFK